MDLPWAAIRDLVRCDVAHHHHLDADVPEADHRHVAVPEDDHRHLASVRLPADDQAHPGADQPPDPVAVLRQLAVAGKTAKRSIRTLIESGNRLS